MFPGKCYAAVEQQQKDLKKTMCYHGWNAMLTNYDFSINNPVDLK